MKYRTFRGTDVRVSEVGFGLWAVSTGWWGTYTDEEAVVLMRRAFDRGVRLFDAADTYGNGRGEELIAKAFADRRDGIPIATKVGSDFRNFGDGRQNFGLELETPKFKSAMDDVVATVAGQG